MIKKLVTLLSLAALAVGVGSTQADAVPCTPGLASAYEALGAAGCQIGDKTFSEFNFTSTEVLDSQIIITPGANILTVGDLGFRLSINGLAALGPNDSTDLLLQYHVAVDDPNFLISDAHLAFTGGATGPGGLAVVNETLCPPGSPCLNDIPTVFDSPVATQVSDSTFFNGVAELDISKDMLVQASGVGDFSSISGVDQTFTQTEATPVPEPATLLLLGSGLAGAGIFGRKRLARKQS
jgi:hypothetical protein